MFAPVQAAIVVNIDKGTQQMSVAVDGTPRYLWPVSTGRAGYDTPNGIFRINRLDADHFSQQWDGAPMPHTMFFDLHGHAIHGFADIKHLGQPVSHGCVRLAPENAAVLFELVQSRALSETTILISGLTPMRGEMARRGPPAGGDDYQPPQPYQVPGYGPPPPGYYYRQAQPQPYYAPKFGRW